MQCEECCEPGDRLTESAAFVVGFVREKAFEPILLPGPRLLIVEGGLGDRLGSNLGRSKGVFGDRWKVVSSREGFRPREVLPWQYLVGAMPRVLT